MVWKSWVSFSHDRREAVVFSGLEKMLTSLLELFNAILARPLAQGDPEADTLLQSIMRTMCLRRKKEMKFVDLKLPELSEYGKLGLGPYELQISPIDKISQSTVSSFGMTRVKNIKLYCELLHPYKKNIYIYIC